MPDTTMRDAPERPRETGALEMTYSVRQIHEMTGVPLSTIYKAVRTGRLRASCLPGMTKGYRVLRRDAERYFGLGACDEPRNA